MEFMTNEEAARYIARGQALREEQHGDITITYGRTGDDGGECYFVLIDDVNLPHPFLFVDHGRLGTGHLFALPASKDQRRAA